MKGKIIMVSIAVYEVLDTVEDIDIKLHCVCENLEKAVENSVSIIKAFAEKYNVQEEVKNINVQVLENGNMVFKCEIPGNLINAECDIITYSIWFKPYELNTELTFSEPFDDSVFMN